MRPGSFLAGTLALGLLLAPVPGTTVPVAAQSPGQGSPALDTVETRIAEGRFPEAREGLERWWEGEAQAPREERQQALWLRARLTVDPAMAELDYRRLVVEYPGGPWSDAALLRLAQGAEFRGDEAAARQYLGILSRDYPQSPYRVEARERLARLEAGEFPPAVGSGTEGTPPSPSPQAAREEAAPEAAGLYTVQLGAFSTEEGARAHAAELGRAGLDVRVVQVDGSPLFRVRSGGFQSRDEAEVAARVPQGMGYPALVATDRDRERAIGG